MRFRGLTVVLLKTEHSMGLKSATNLMVGCLLIFRGAEGWADEPLFKNSIVSTEFDFITAADPSAFESLRFLGQGRREMPDKRNNSLLANDTFLFEARFRDDSKVKIWPALRPSDSAP